MKLRIPVLMALGVMITFDMLRTILSFLLLRKLRKSHPEMFDGKAAALSIKLSIEETLAEYATLYGDD